MLAAARVEAARAGVHVELIQARIEDLPAGIGVFQAITIGRALHWFDRDETLAILERIVAENGWIAICGTKAHGAAVKAGTAGFMRSAAPGRRIRTKDATTSISRSGSAVRASTK